ncbi:MAG: hypothetical protein ACHQXA_01105 [Gemmatimonadales bacterium]
MTLPSGTTALDAVRAFDPALAERIAAGEGHLTDGRGIALPPATAIGPGAIIRAVVSARRGARTAEFDALS